VALLHACGANPEPGAATAPTPPWLCTATLSSRPCLSLHPAATCILFGDGCGAVVLSANPDPFAPGAILGMDMGSDGHGHKHLHCEFAGARRAGKGTVHYATLSMGVRAGCSCSGEGKEAGGRRRQRAHVVAAGSGLKPLSEGGAPSSHASYGNIHMAGQDVFKFAVRTVPTVRCAHRLRLGLWAP
jgi:3-oxoacyl-[acyl-carrier-protein] synthase-3